MASKPSPQLTFLWAIGLNILHDIWLKVTGQKRGPEPKKPIIVKSSWKALQRCSVHILPCAVSLVLIILHTSNYFMGHELNGPSGKTNMFMAMLQVAAKTQELLIIASLATVVVHQLRSDLVKGPGVPFGLVGATVLFNQIHFFWSSTFWGSILHRPFTNFKLLTLMIVSGLIAATAGPAVAVLLIPRQHTWNAGGSMYWINGTADDLWPRQVELNHYMPNTNASLGKANCTSPYAYTNPLCPSGGYLSLVQGLSTGFYRQELCESKDSPFDDVDLLSMDSGAFIRSPGSQMKSYTLVSARRGLGSVDSGAVAVHGPAAWVSETLSDDWGIASRTTPRDWRFQTMRYRYYTRRMSFVNASVPAVRVACTVPRLVSRNGTGVTFAEVRDYDSIAKASDGWESASFQKVWDRNMSALRGSVYSEFPRITELYLGPEDRHITNSSNAMIIGTYIFPSS